LQDITLPSSLFNKRLHVYFSFVIAYDEGKENTTS
jgi:hypothetical protein